jgi:hypothetical protein
VTFREIRGPKLSPVTRLHAADPQYAKDLNYNYNSRKTKNNLEEGEHGKNINSDN